TYNNENAKERAGVPVSDLFDYIVDGKEKVDNAVDPAADVDNSAQEGTTSAGPPFNAPFERAGEAISSVAGAVVDKAKHILPGYSEPEPTLDETDKGSLEKAGEAISNAAAAAYEGAKANVGSATAAVPSA
ncbi:hypothetical protein PMAYCL1PPCAC_00601, partial [Pristionchus mayeri]